MQQYICRQAARGLDQTLLTTLLDISYGRFNLCRMLCRQALGACPGNTLFGQEVHQGRIRCSLYPEMIFELLFCSAADIDHVFQIGIVDQFLVGRLKCPPDLVRLVCKYATRRAPVHQTHFQRSLGWTMSLQDTVGGSPRRLLNLREQAAIERLGVPSANAVSQRFRELYQQFPICDQRAEIRTIVSSPLTPETHPLKKP
ncbi:hypothetical protein ASF71_19640 [Deinococcus sp. Leaf326]|nr:hypothetical protein ASF71_19640 [Deinococcus sp. Leaf326]